jgi:UDP-2,4-diacetamido-2,4,6-trideoxy-beta-L-altropyranose hydrolase
MRICEEAGERSVAFRVEASPVIGIGHLRRCLTLAAELHQRGCHVCFVCRDQLGTELESLMEPHKIHWLENIQRGAGQRDAAGEELRDAEATLSVLDRRRTALSWVVLDHYQLGHRWEKKVRDVGHRIMVIDDCRNRKHHADLLVSDSKSPFNPALNELASTAQVLVGWDYALVDATYSPSGPFENTMAGPKRFLVSYGGSDPTGETLKALEAVRALRMDEGLRHRVGRVDVVVGLANPNSAAIVQAVEGIEHVIVHQALPSLGPLMRQADLILTAGGNSMVEALALRKPCIVTVTADNQALMVGELEAEGVIWSLGGHAQVKPGDVLKMTTYVTADFDAFAARVASRPIFDHLGAHRIATVMLASERTT